MSTPHQKAKVFWFFFSKKNKILFLLLVLFTVQSAAAELDFHPPFRAFGYFPGDILRTNATIALRQGEHVDANSLPAPGALTPSIELRAIGVRQEGARAVVSAEYQTFLTADHVTAGEIPAYTLRLASATGVRNIRIPSWSFYVSPIRLLAQTGEMLAELQPDSTQPAQPESPLFVRAAMAAAAALALAAVLALRFGLLRPHLARGAFAAAVRDIQRCRREAGDPAKAFLALHRAFDAFAGRRLFAGDLPRFIAEHPRFVPLAPRIAAFFAASQRRFFARATPEDADPRGVETVLSLARALRRLERRA